MSLSSVITASVLLLVIMGIRCFFGKNMSKRVLYGLWLFAAVKLFVPLPVSNAFYLMNFFQTEENQVNLSGEDARSSGASAVRSASNQNQTSAKRKEAAGTSSGNF
ncbi:MAG: hypothetical protein IJ733_13480 [Lachnospiraceae bacterium]|nr:hypothetical protein [Lachnospiraceae bacterium]